MFVVSTANIVVLQSNEINGFNVTKRDSRAIAWELGDLLTPQGLITRDAPIGLSWLPPVQYVSISGGDLVWRLRKPDRVVDGVAIHNLPIPSIREQLDKTTRSHCEQDMLGRFVELHRSTDREILEYAKFWGQLKLCEHNVPHRHGALTGFSKYRL